MNEKITNSRLQSFFPLFALFAVELIFGLLMVLSASSVIAMLSNGAPITYYFARQFVAAVIGGILMFFIDRNLNSNNIQKVHRIYMTVCLIILFLVLVLGTAAGGNQNWITISSFSLQPSELAKPGYILSLAYFLYKNNNLEPRLQLGFIAKSHLKRLIRRGNSSRLLVVTHFISVLFKKHTECGLMIIALVLIFCERDLGTIIIYSFITFGMIVISGAKNTTVVAVTAVAAIGMFFGIATSENRRNRILAALFGCTTANDSLCYQRKHATFAFATGGLTGVGPGASREKWTYLPAPHNDFIFAVVGEEFGFIGSVLLVICILAITVLIINISQKQKTQFEKLVVVGIAIWYFSQSIINICVASVANFPVIGVTLPLVSYGGSSLIANMIGFGIIFSLSKTRPTKPIRLFRKWKRKNTKRVGQIDVMGEKPANRVPQKTKINTKRTY